ncbi:hypothetical protein FKN93_14815 [Vibrio sp. A8-1]|nr:hypothetical protein [Vibrio sp. A8-1]
MKLQRCWLRSFTSITSSVYAYGDELTCRLPATLSCLGIDDAGYSFVESLNKLNKALRACWCKGSVFHFWC